MTSSTTRAVPRLGMRLSYLDNMKVVFTAAVITHHACITYSPIPAWMYLEPPDSTGMTLPLVVGLNQAFHMPFFFLLSGFFTAASRQRHGVAHLARDRIVRLGIPLLVSCLLLQPLSTLWIWTQLTPRPGLASFWVQSVMPGVAWYLEVLLILVLTYCVLHRLLDREGRRRPGPVAGPANPQTYVAGPPVGTVQILFTALGVAVLTFLWRLIVPDRTVWAPLGMPSPSQLPQ